MISQPFVEQNIAIFLSCDNTSLNCKYSSKNLNFRYSFRINSYSLRFTLCFILNNNVHTTEIWITNTLLILSRFFGA